MNILITGGASGLGLAITERLAKENNLIYFTYFHSEKNALYLENKFSNVKAIRCNFSNKNDMEKLIQTINEIPIDALINNAFSGSFISDHFHKTPATDFLMDFMTNILPVIEITKNCIIKFRKQKQGKIVTLLTAALEGIPPAGTSVYLAGKAYLEKLSKIWASENVKYNITSNSVSPAFMETSLTSEMDQRVKEMMLQQHPLKKFLQTDEVAEMVYFLLNTTQQLNGVDLLVNAAQNIRK